MREPALGDSEVQRRTQASEPAPGQGRGGAGPIEFSLTNFKAFADTARLPLRPIVLVFGENSSGKSSIIQALLLLKQTIEQSDDPEPPLLPKGRLVDLGNFREMVHRHDESRPIGLDFAFGPTRASTRSRLLAQVGAPSGLRLEFVAERGSGGGIAPSVGLMAGGQSTAAFSLGRGEERSRSTEPVYAFRSADFEHVVWRRLWELQRRQQNDAPVSDLDAELRRLEKARADLQARLSALRAKADDLDRSLDETETTRDRQRRPPSAQDRRLQELRNLTLLQRQLESELAHNDAVTRQIWELVEPLTYEQTIARWREALPGLRVQRRNFLPTRVLSGPDGWVDEELYSVTRSRTASAQDVTDATLEVAGRLQAFLSSLVHLGPLRQTPARHYVFSGVLADSVGPTGAGMSDILFKKPAVVSRVNALLSSFRLGYELEIVGASATSGALSDVFAVRAVDQSTGVDASLMDVGFGISQVLPILVECSVAPRRTLLIEQPEIHLHPGLQAELGSLFAEAIRPPFSCRFVIETHSEHVILRLKRLIRRGQLRPDDVAIVYVARGPDGSKIIPIRLDERGEFLDHWPGGFFEEGFRETFDGDVL